MAPPSIWKAGQSYRIGAQHYIYVGLSKANRIFAHEGKAVAEAHFEAEVNGFMTPLILRKIPRAYDKCIRSMAFSAPISTFEILVTAYETWATGVESPAGEAEKVEGLRKQFLAWQKSQVSGSATDESEESDCFEDPNFKLVKLLKSQAETAERRIKILEQ